MFDFYMLKPEVLNPSMLLSLQSKRLILQLRGRINELEAELAEQQHLKQQALDENEFVKAELEEVKKKQDVTEKAQRSLTEIERKFQIRIPT